jgi:type IV pilus modification protein PilV
MSALDYPAPKTQTGIMLIEAMIGLLIFSIAILGMISLQANLLKETQQSQQRAEASYLANEVISLIWTTDRANQRTFDTDQYAGAGIDTDPVDPISFTDLINALGGDPDQVRLATWAAKANTLMPNGSVRIDVAAPPAVTAPIQVSVTMNWTFREDIGNNAGQNVTRSFRTVALVGP